MKYLTLLVLFLAGLQSAAIAYDIPPPRPQPKPTAPADDAATDNTNKQHTDPIKQLADLQRFSIRIDEKAKSAKLVIPNAVIRALQADGAKPGAFFPSSGNYGPSMVNRTGTIVGGVLMTMAVMLGGLWFVRSRKVSAPNLAALTVLLLISGAGTASWGYANFGPPPEARSLTSKIVKYGFVTGELQVETTNDADEIVLILPIAK
jgi:hypothetical protein